MARILWGQGTISYLYLKVMVQLDEATYGDFARTVATIIAENNEAVKRRNKKPAQETPTQE
jgi:hypothetical protein